MTPDVPTIIPILTTLAAQEDPAVTTVILRDDARAILALLFDHGKERAKWQRLAETRAGLDDEGRRKLAEAAQIRASADNVSHNADRRVNETWRELGEVRALLVGVLAILDAVPLNAMSDENRRVLKAAREAMSVAPMNPPRDDANGETKK